MVRRDGITWCASGGQRHYTGCQRYFWPCALAVMARLQRHFSLAHKLRTRSATPALVMGSRHNFVIKALYQTTGPHVHHPHALLMLSAMFTIFGRQYTIRNRSRGQSIVHKASHKTRCRPSRTEHTVTPVRVLKLLYTCVRKVCAAQPRCSG